MCSSVPLAPSSQFVQGPNVVLGLKVEPKRINGQSAGGPALRVRQALRLDEQLS